MKKNINFSSFKKHKKNQDLVIEENKSHLSLEPQEESFEKTKKISKIFLKWNGPKKRY